MKPCPVCNTQVEDLYTGFCPNQVCTWEFEFVSEMTPEVQRRYEEKLRRAILTFQRFKAQDETPPPTEEPPLNNEKRIPVKDPNSKKWGYINEKGVEKIAFVYDKVFEFENGVALVSKNGKYGFIDKQNNVKLDMIYDSIQPAGNGLFITSRFKKYGILNKEFNFVYGIEFDMIDFISNTFILIKSQSKIYLNLKLKEIQENEFLAEYLKDMFVKVEGGTFTPGDANPSNKVTLSTYSISKYPVTQELWKLVMNDNPSTFKGSDLPVEKVSWFDANEFCARLNQLTGKNYRLPTEAEWEFAARGGTRSKGFEYSGSNNANAVAWFDQNSNNMTHPVGIKQPNELGLFDMSGNVWEWCSDWYGNYPNVAQTNPQGPSTGSYRVFRGGSWSNIAQDCRSAYRYYNSPVIRHINIGFRLVSPK